MPFSPLTPLPTAPQRTDTPEDFITKADAWVAAATVVTGQLNTFISELETAAALIAAAPAYADPGLVALSGNTPATDRLPYYNGASTSALATFTSAARTLVAQTTQALLRTAGLGMSANGSSLVSAADYAAMKALLDLEAGTDFLSPAAIAAAYQPLDGDLTAIAALTTTSFGRALIEQADAAATLATIGAAADGALTGGATSGSFTIAGFTVTWRDITAGAGSNAFAYGSSHSYSTWARAWVNGDDGANDVSLSITSHGTTTATVRNEGSSCAAVLFAIGV